MSLIQPHHIEESFNLTSILENLEQIDNRNIFFNEFDQEEDLVRTDL